MSGAENASGNMGAAMTDGVVTFQLESTALRGRLARLGPELDGILGRHAYPAPVGRFLAETLTVAVLLSSMLKYEGVFTLQARGDGPISLMVADVSSEGRVRAYAQFDPAKFEGERGVRMEEDYEIAPAAALLGKGHLAFTVDQGDDTDRYQGIVELYGKTLADCVQHYFRQSEQIDTAVAIMAEHREAGWVAGGMMLQRMPEEGGTPLASNDADGWRRAMVLMTTVTGAELLPGDVSPEQALYRLFHEEGVRVWPAKSLTFGCRCSDGRVRAMLAGMAKEDVEHMKVDGVIEVTCQFCSSVYRYDDEALKG